MITADAAPGSAGTTLLLTILSAGGGGAIIAAIVSGLFSKRKLGAEAAEIISKAAAGVVINLEADVARQIKAREASETESRRRMDAMAAAHVAERSEWQRVLQLHVAWDALAIAKLAELDVELPPAPPLLPAQRHVDEAGYPLH